MDSPVCGKLLIDSGIPIHPSPDTAVYCKKQLSLQKILHPLIYLMGHVRPSRFLQEDQRMEGGNM